MAENDLSKNPKKGREINLPNRRAQKKGGERKREEFVAKELSLWYKREV